MQIMEYTSLDPVNKINKTLTQIGTVTGTLKGECDLISPSITIQVGSFPSRLNYVYVVDFDRYYFVTNISLEINGLYTISTEIDVLMSYKDDILQQTAIIERQENQYDLYLEDPIFRTEQKTQTQILEFADGFDNTATPSILLYTI